MIRVAKSLAAPATLVRRGAVQSAIDATEYDRDPDAYRNAVKRFEAKSGIYGSEVVKRKLMSDQHSKCCFCESIFDANVAGDVEHYRPKGAVEVGGNRLLPGYYWLAYTWDNLYYACPDCNQYRKRDRFPLIDEQARARSHHDDIGLEAPLLLEPGIDDPRDHIAFKAEAIEGTTPRGRKTVELLKLDRIALARERLEHLEILTDYHDGIIVLADRTDPEAVDLVARFRAKLAAARLPTSKFSAAASDHLNQLAIGRPLLPSI